MEGQWSSSLKYLTMNKNEKLINPFEYSHTASDRRLGDGEAKLWFMGFIGIYWTVFWYFIDLIGIFRDFIGFSTKINVIRLIS